MSTLRIKDLPNTATASSSGDFLPVDGTSSGTRKLNAHSPRFGGNVTVDGSITGGSASLTTPLPLTSGGTGASTQAGAANAVLPTQSTSSGKFLTTDGSNVSWGSSSVAWGSITGTLSNQTDLNSALSGKAPSTTTTSILYGNGSGGFSGVTVGGGLTFSTGTLSANVTSVSGRTGAVTLTSSDVSLGNVTNDAQTKAAIVPNTTPTSGQILVGNAGGTAYAPVSSSGDVTVASTGAFTIGASKVTNAMLAGSIDLTTKVTGALPVANGGTGATSATTAATNLGLGTTSNVTFNTVSDASGSVRAIPQNAQTSAYTLVIGDVGKHISITTGGVTVPASVFAAGDVVSVYNNSTASQTLTQGTSTTIYLAGTSTTGNRTLAQRGVCTVLCVASNTFVVSGGGLT